MTVGDRIKAVRESIGMTQEELGKLCGVTKQTIFKYENNIITNIPLDKLKLISSGLNISAAKLMDWETEGDGINLGLDQEKTGLSKNGRVSLYPRLRVLRESLGMTQEEFGKSINIAKSTYNNYETGIREPKSDFWIAVAKKYNVTIDYLMGFSDEPHKMFDETKNSTNTAEAALEEEINALFDILQTGLISAGLISDGQDLTDRQTDILIGVCKILRAIFDD